MTELDKIKVYCESLDEVVQDNVAIDEEGGYAYHISMSDTLLGCCMDW